MRAKAKLTALPAAALAAALVLPAAGAQAQEQGDPKAGRAYAERDCAECHAVGPEGGPMDLSGAMSFKIIANRRDTTAISIAAWMESEHENMPHIIPKPHELNNVIAYIMSLKE